MADPWQWWAAEQIAAATGCPQANVETNWPLILTALDARGISDRAVQIAAIGTVAIETASTFEPVREAFWLDDDWRREYLRYYPYYGRGYIQLTWAENYTAYGNDIGVDLHTEPDRALDPHIAAQVLAAYFAQHGGGAIPRAARAGDWPKVRRLVQGGTAGLDRLVAIATTLEGAAPMPTTPIYNPDTPLILQNDDWSCWACSARMSVESWGRHPSESWFEAQAIADGIESTAAGLLDGSGAAGAAWLTRQYSDPAEGTPTLKASNAASVSFDDVKSVAGTVAVMLGGHRWGVAGHWAFVRRYDPATDQLMLGNPAGTYDGIAQTMDRQQFARVSPCSMILVVADGAAVAQPPAPPPVDELAALRAEVARLKTVIGYCSADISAALDKEVATIRASLGALEAATTTLRGQN